ncbi:MAG: hypothetical protein FJX23_07155 [Alphaproteobacteria bacterium]|nr:hypothetical protein [Alphaproteobacteria bacterium]
MATENGIIIEFSGIGNVVKVSAIDMATGTEVSIVGPASHPEALLKANVLRKLKYVMEKKQS